MVWGALTEEEMDVIYENADFETGYRCFNWPHCVDSNSCTRISEGKDLAELIETCLNDDAAGKGRLCCLIPIHF